MLVDNIDLIIKAGNGGNGALSFIRNGVTFKGGPDGGNGGRGGSIYFQGSNNINDLREFRYKKKITAENGVNGGKDNRFGKNAENITIFLPLGTRITESDSGKTYEILDIKTAVLLAAGGKGGRGNNEFKSATNQTPRFVEKGGLGEEKKLFLELRLIAEIGIIGLPNAGKSSLLAVLTNSKPKIANYPFTTLEPNIGMFGKYPIADIPGLIEGASAGRGLGITFLKHIEKTKILIHCIEVGNKDLLKNYAVVRNEFSKYNAELLEKLEIILITKTDLVDEKTVKKAVDVFKKQRKKVLACSLYDSNSINTLKETLEKIL